MDVFTLWIGIEILCGVILLVGFAAWLLFRWVIPIAYYLTIGLIAMVLGDIDERRR